LAKLDVFVTRAAVKNSVNACWSEVLAHIEAEEFMNYWRELKRPLAFILDGELRWEISDEFGEE
jgi:hypothetical protein